MHAPRGLFRAREIADHRSTTRLQQHTAHAGPGCAPRAAGRGGRPRGDPSGLPPRAGRPWATRPAERPPGPRGGPCTTLHHARARWQTVLAVRRQHRMPSASSCEKLHLTRASSPRGAARAAWRVEGSRWSAVRGAGELSARQRAGRAIREGAGDGARQHPHPRGSGEGGGWGVGRARAGGGGRAIRLPAPAATDAPGNASSRPSPRPRLELTAARARSSRGRRVRIQLAGVWTRLVPRRVRIGSSSSHDLPISGAPDLPYPRMSVLIRGYGRPCWLLPRVASKRRRLLVE